PPISSTQPCARTAEKSLHGRDPLFAALVATEKRRLGIFERDADFLQLGCIASPRSRSHGMLCPACLCSSARLHPMIPRCFALLRKSLWFQFSLYVTILPKP